VIPDTLARPPVGERTMAPNIKMVTLVETIVENAAKIKITQ
jgi:hypothetical protein